jgi:ABC-type multidrug transport system fused ATPase/permease subunit
MIGRTSIVIAHRLTTIEKCNRVVVLEHGQVAEEGNFNELQTMEGGHFRKLKEGTNKQL